MHANNLMCAPFDPFNIFIILVVIGPNRDFPVIDNKGTPIFDIFPYLGQYVLESQAIWSHSNREIPSGYFLAITQEKIEIDIPNFSFGEFEVGDLRRMIIDDPWVALLDTPHTNRSFLKGIASSNNGWLVVHTEKKIVNPFF